jgi:hypothetical protein
VATQRSPDHESNAETNIPPTIHVDPPDQPTVVLYLPKPNPRSRISPTQRRWWRLSSQQPNHFHQAHTHLVNTSRSHHNKAKRQGIRVSRGAHLLMVDAMDTTAPLALLPRPPRGGTGAAATCGTGDALNAMAIPPSSSSPQPRSHGEEDETRCRRVGRRARDLDSWERSWLVVAGLSSGSTLPRPAQCTLALQPRTARLALKKGRETYFILFVVVIHFSI